MTASPDRPLRYVDAGAYDGGRFFRTVKLDNQPDNDVRIEVVQAGMDPEQEDHAFDAIVCAYTGYLFVREAWQMPVDCAAVPARDSVWELRA